MCGLGVQVHAPGTHDARVVELRGELRLAYQAVAPAGVVGHLQGHHLGLIGVDRCVGVREAAGTPHLAKPAGAQLRFENVIADHGTGVVDAGHGSAPTSFKDNSD